MSCSTRSTPRPDAASCRSADALRCGDGWYDDVAVPREDYTGGDPQRRRLAAAVGTDERMHLPRPQVEVDAVECDHRAVDRGDAPHVEDDVAVGGLALD